MLGLYLHVPFCQAICSYCHFNRGLFDADLKARYVDAIAREIHEAGDGSPVDTIFFGGGTPSLLEPDEVARLITACRDVYDVAADAEITLETNPETASPERLAGFRTAGANRLSFGVQSFDDEELRRLGRIHSADRAADAVGQARGAGFANVSFDLMLWLPGQSPASWRRTVARAIALAPDHLSLYLLELYPNAPLKDAMARGAAGNDPGAPGWRQVTDDEAADMYLEALDALDAAGYAQYEISNVARPGHASRHNLKYWQSGRWRGFGCGAHSTVGERRWHNVYATGEYIDAVRSGHAVARGEAVRTAPEQLEEALFTGLRLTEGIDCGNFEARYGVNPWAVHGRALAPAIEAGLVWVRGGRFGLTRAGMLMANEVMTVFV
jgi:oxygen-independent coproporphyrinogen-3 oxidase